MQLLQCVEYTQEEVVRRMSQADVLQQKMPESGLASSQALLLPLRAWCCSGFRGLGLRFFDSDNTDAVVLEACLEDTAVQFPDCESSGRSGEG